MAVELSTLVATLRREVSPPGTDLYPDALDAEFIGHLADAFWEARLSGIEVLDDYEVNASNQIVPTDATTDDLTRDLQQLLVLFAGYRIVLSSFQNIKSAFRAQAGPVSYETARSAQLLRDVLKALERKIGIILTRLSDLGTADTDYFDAVIARETSMVYGDTWWVR